METNDFLPDPLRQFELWLEEARQAGGLEWPNAMSLATVGADGKPHNRMILLKGLNKSGFVFFTNYESRKAEDLGANPFAALCFYWEKMGHQVRVEGKVEKTSAEESLSYFHTRPRGSQVGAWASPQSRKIATRQELEAKVAEIDTRFSGIERLPLPPYWGGYVVVPERVEFWINGVNRLHDRFVYTRAASTAPWAIARLAP